MFCKNLSSKVVRVFIPFLLQNYLTFIAVKPRISGCLSLRILLISWWFLIYVRTKDFISSSEITLDKAMLYRVRKYVLKTEIHTPKKTVYISNALCNIYKPMKLYISHLAMNINLFFYAIVYVSKRFKNIVKMLLTIGNGTVFIWSTL